MKRRISPAYTIRVRRDSGTIVRVPKADRIFSQSTITKRRLLDIQYVRVMIDTGIVGFELDDTVLGPIGNILLTCL
jgi:hypothetical protein